MLAASAARVATALASAEAYRSTRDESPARPDVSALLPRPRQAAAEKAPRARLLF